MTLRFARGFTALEILAVTAIAGIIIALTVSTLGPRATAQYIDINHNKLLHAFMALDKAYYSYCRDPSTAPAIDADLLKSKGWITDPELNSPLTAAPISVGLAWGPPAKLHVELTAESSQIADLIIKRWGSGVRTGTQVRIERVPRLYNAQTQHDRASFAALFAPIACTI